MEKSKPAPPQVKISKEKAIALYLAAIVLAITSAAVISKAPK